MAGHIWYPWATSLSPYRTVFKNMCSAHQGKGAISPAQWVVKANVVLTLIPGPVRVRQYWPFKRDFQAVGGWNFLSLSLRSSDSSCLTSGGNPLRTTLHENYTGSLCLHSRETDFPRGQRFGAGDEPKQFHTRAVEFVSKNICLSWLFGVWMGSRRIQLVAAKCDSVYFN